MRQFDLSPLYRNTVGSTGCFPPSTSSPVSRAPPTYPPYNIERTSENDYRISVAVAGFTQDDLTHQRVKEHVLGDPCARSRKARNLSPRPRCCIRASPRAPSSVASSSPTAFRCGWVPASKTGSCM